MNKKMILSFALLGVSGIVSLIELFFFQSIWMLLGSIFLLVSSIVIFILGIIELKKHKNR